MASALQKLLRKSAATRIIPPSFHFHTPQVEPLALHRSPLNIEVHRPVHATEHVGSSRCNVIFPSFPFGLSSNPILVTGPLSHESEDDESGMLWADSVKKKRKRKMNKHKYKKLRKRMRRQK